MGYSRYKAALQVFYRFWRKFLFHLSFPCEVGFLDIAGYHKGTFLFARHAARFKAARLAQHLAGIGR